MFSQAFRSILNLPKPWNLVAIVALVLVLGGVIFYSLNSIQSCGYSKARAEYQKKEDAAKAERDKLIGQIEQRDKEIAALESQKEQYKTLAEQGVKLDQEHAKQIEEITTQEAQDLEHVRQDMDCRTRATNTVSLLLTAKPPIKLNLADVIKKQCS